MPTLIDGTAWEIQMRCEAADDPRVTTIRLEPGYSRTDGICVVATAHNREGELVSETVTKHYPPDCIALSEPPAEALSLAGLVAVALIGQRRRHLRAASRVQHLEPEP